MFKKISTSIFIIALLIPLKISAQTAQWITLPGAPLVNVKIDDCYFIDSETGWVVSGFNFSGIFKTTNGGIDWNKQFSNNIFFRCVGFVNSLTGWVGTLTPANVLITTTDGGITWSDVALPSPVPQGICGVYVLDSLNIFACGRYNGPAHFIKTTNGGVNWTTSEMEPAVTSLVDCYFFNRDSGFVIGGLGLPITINARPVVLFTSDGGSTWVNRYTGVLNKEWCWKITFLNASTGFIAIESYRFVDTMSYLKTTDRGLSWIENRVEIDTNIFHEEGIGFISPMTGWIGGYNLPVGFGAPTEGKTKETTDEGLTWHPVTWGYNINRIRFLNDTLAYAVGKTVYKYTNDTTVGINNLFDFANKDFNLYQNYPNPFNPETAIKYEINQRTLIRIIIYDIQGKEIFSITQNKIPGKYEFLWNGKNNHGYDAASGVYYYTLVTNKFSESKKMVLIR